VLATSRPPSAANVADFVVRDAGGAELHLDFSYTGVSYSGTVTGAGSVSLDGTNYTAIAFTESDLERSTTRATSCARRCAMSRAGTRWSLSAARQRLRHDAGHHRRLNNTDGLPAADVTDRMGQLAR
jgi:hypothetical protein